MVVIRLSRSGAKKNPYFFITVADSRKPRDGRFIERLGFFNPSAQGSEERLRFNLERFEYWVSKGAQASERVQALKEESELSPEDLDAKFEKRNEKRKLRKETQKTKKAEELAQAAEEETPAEEEATEDNKSSDDKEK